MPHPYRIAAALLLAAVAAACDKPTGGEGRTPAIPMGTVVEGQLEPGGANEYRVVAPAADFRIMLHARSGSAADTLFVELTSDAGGVLDAVTSVGTDSVLSEQVSQWLRAAPQGSYRLRVRGRSADDRGPYSLQLYTHNPAPEKAAAVVSVGQTVHEAMDVPDDVDEFTLQGTAGQELIIFFQSEGQVGALLDLQLMERGTTGALARVSTAAPTGALEVHSTSRVPLPRTGTYVVRVSADARLGRTMRGPYRFRVDAVNRAPEAAGAALAPGAVVGEAIGTVGDVDEFTFSASPGQEMNLLVQLQQAMSLGLRVELLRGAQPLREVVAHTPTASLDDLGTGRIVLSEGGTYTVRVSGPDMGTAAEATGSYRFELYPVDRRAEAGGEVRVDGATVAGVIDRPGDVDEFPLAGTAGQLVVLHASGAPVRSPLHAQLVAPDGTALSDALVTVGGGTSYARRVRLPATGTYTVRVTGPHAVPGTGPFTLGAYTVSPAPEHLPPTLAIGQTITGERIDRPGDLDVFTFAGQAGREVSLFLGAPADVGAISLSVRPVTWRDPIVFTHAGPMSLDRQSTGRMVLESVAYEVVVDPQLFPGVVNYAEGGTYGLRVFPINRAPEGRSAAYVLGDTVRTEPLYPSGDVDEYRFQLAAATPLRIFWQGPGGDPANAVWGVLYNDATGAVVWSNFDNDEAGPVRQITLPAGRYRLSVLNMNLDAPSETAQNPVVPLAYRFAFIP